MIEGRAMGSMGANCYLYACMESKKAVIIDPGADGKRIYRWVLEKGLKVDYILLTHGHVDHIGAVDELRELLGEVSVGIHAGDAGMLTDGKQNLSSYFGPGLVLKKADFLLQDGQELAIGKEVLKVISTPGHSPGGVCFLCSEGLFSGDTLFAGSIGRTDFPGGSMEQLLDGVKKKLLILPEETRVFPGHGEETSIGEEKRDNPFLL
ncbi:MBL fold metallo-hydrolase [Desulfosporosinus metallidurans]|uniref:Hydroxyacylglutathione hydrolase n=1 Tax=Desulfosporosinus metallidurans TaxID=1888891 RepID=A0A1Q8QY74_9FIRM|nr:MBL fold metallo-hydrolase [Desulfosporosinus metallidurans]OLN32274.1 Hydroxyacylglutathione hydrolase [Desulfosporosinus metallidurans]